MSVNSRVLATVASRFDTATLVGGAYSLLNPGGLTHPCFMIRIVNDSTITIEISYNGTATHDIVRSGGQYELNFQTNSQVPGKRAFFEAGKLVYLYGDVKLAPKGYVYLIGYYQE